MLVQEILDVIVARDALQKKLENTDPSAESLVKVSELDRDLKKQFEALSRKIPQEGRCEILNQLEELQKVCKSKQKAWWWFPKIYVHWWNRFDAIMSVLCFVWLLAILSLLIDIVSVFSLLGGISSLLDSWAVILQIILALSSVGTLTKTGQTFVETILKSIKIPKHLWKEAKFVAASLLLFILVGLRISFPRIALVYTETGLRNYEVGRIADAKSNYEWALALNPNHAPTYLYLGVLFDTQPAFRDIQQARRMYQIAMRSGSARALNNMARLEILEGDYEQAEQLLIQLKANPTLEDDMKLRYGLHKNLGWVNLKRGRLAEAESELLTAIEDIAEPAQLSEKVQASAHCLLAQILEAKGHVDQAKPKWEYCYRFVNNQILEEQEWHNTAGKKLGY